MHEATSLIVERERELYTRIWQDPRYRKQSPALMVLGTVVDVMSAHFNLHPEAGATLIDYGSGTGKIIPHLIARGYNVASIDLAPNALEFPANARHFDCAIHDAPDIVADAGYCIDVMEHIPPELVDVTLERIADLTPCCYFRIATRLDMFGPIISGRHLHVSVHPAAWWEAKISEYFPHVYVQGEHNDTACFIAGSRHA